MTPPPPADRGALYDHDTMPDRIVRPRPPRILRWMRRGLIAGCSVVVLLGLFNLVLAVAALIGSAVEDISRPPLCSDLPRDVGAAELAFADRVRQRFPLGMPFRDLEAELAAQGFSPILPSAGRLNPGARYVVRGLGREIWCEVRWTTDARGTVASIRPLVLERPR